MLRVVPCESPTAGHLIIGGGAYVHVRPGRYGWRVGDLLQLKLGPRRGLKKGTSAVAWYERGVALEASDPAGAMAAYGRALAGRPDLADAHNNLGRLHHDRGELAVAESSYRLAICIGGNIPLYWFNLGVVLEDQGRHAEALTSYARSLELSPEISDAHFNAARLLEQLARATGDEELLRQAVRHLARYRALLRAI
jgi:tetratricopeptide (TPR) repeat protein